MKKRFLFLLCDLFLVANSNAQMRSMRDSSLVVPLIGFDYAFHIPGSDMAQRFGTSHTVGAVFLIKTKKNWVFGTDWNFVFGNHIREPKLMQNLYTPDGNIINKNGEFAQVRMFERGHFVSLKAGRVFTMPWTNKNSGFMILGYVGALQHKLRIEVTDNNVDALSAEYKKGYDRLSNGLAFGQFIGYLHLSKNRLMNAFAGFEFVQAFTKNRRSYNFDTMEKDNALRMDLLNGFKVGFTLPLYKRMPQEYYFN